jgi:hypothetical protein
MTRSRTSTAPQVWVHQTIQLPSGASMGVCSVPFDRWMEETDTASHITKHRTMSDADKHFMLNLRAELEMVADKLEPGSEHEHEGYLLTRIMAPFPDVEEHTAISSIAAMSRLPTKH